MEHGEPANGFYVSGKLPGLNEYTRANRGHWSNGAAMKAAAEVVIRSGINQATRAGKCRHVDGPCGVVFIWYEENRKRDIDNIVSAKKYILDAMQQAGILDGDGQRYVVGLLDTVVQAEHCGVDVRIVAPKVLQDGIRRMLEDGQNGSQSPVK